MIQIENPIFNNSYYITKLLGKGNTAKVYLGLAVDQKTKPRKVAIKILKSEFAEKDSLNLQSVMLEAEILQSLCHEGIVGFVSHGRDGVI